MTTLRYVLPLTAALGLALSGCAGGGDSGGTNTNPPGGATVRGTVFAPNGQIPLAGATVTAPDAGRATTTTGPDGKFTLPGVAVGPAVNITIAKGQWSKTIQKNTSTGGVIDLTPAETTLPSQGAGAPKIAVVAGSFDNMEDVLAKFGMANLSTEGRYVAGTEKFDVYGIAGKPSTESLFSTAATLNQYQIVFINCGAEEDPILNATNRTNIRNFVNNGGVLYVTDQAYDYVEQVFPNAIDFVQGGSPAANVAEDKDAAQVGEGGIKIDADVMQQTLQQWLAARNSLTPAGKLHVEGFLGGWAVIDSLGQGTTQWVRGNVTYNGKAGAAHHHGHSHKAAASGGRATGVKPLTVSFTFGQGRVLYSSYHTVEEPSPQLRPQENVLGFLAFSL